MTVHQVMQRAMHPQILHGCSHMSRLALTVQKIIILKKKLKIYLINNKALEKCTADANIRRIQSLCTFLNTSNYRKVINLSCIPRICNEKKLKSCNKKLSYQTQRSYITALRHLANFLKCQNWTLPCLPLNLLFLIKGWKIYPKAKRSGFFENSGVKARKT